MGERGVGERNKKSGYVLNVLKGHYRHCSCPPLLQFCAKKLSKAAGHYSKVISRKPHVEVKENHKNRLNNRSYNRVLMAFYKQYNTEL